MPTGSVTAPRLAGLFFVVYLAAFLSGVSGQWFNPNWTTDDATQQLFPFYKVIYPQAFQGDLIYTQMRAYLPSIHYGLGWIFMHFFANPVMVGHAIMLLQLGLSVFFIFAAVRYAAGTTPAFFAAVWFLHSRPIVERVTGGLPRGWAPALICAYLYLMLKGRHRAVLSLSVLGWFLQPVVTFLMLMAYGFFLVWRLFTPSTRKEAVRPCTELALTLPIIALCAVLGTRMPEEIGTMRTLAEASSMADFQRPHGRFPILPFKHPWREIKTFGFQAFTDRWHHPPRTFRKALPFIALGLLAFLTVAALHQKRELIPAQVLSFGAAALVTYFLSRVFAFRLYVPDRHLLIPLALFFIFAFTIGLWRLFLSKSQETCAVQENIWVPFIVLCFFALFISTGSGSGLKGDLAFNYRLDVRSPVFAFFKEHSPQNALIAGDPQFLDPLPLLSARRVYASVETVHPFYDRYYSVVKPRFDRAQRATYAKSFDELQEIFDEEPSYRPDYMVFSHRLFTPESLRKLSKETEMESLLGTQLAKNILVDKENFIFYQDADLTVVDMKALAPHD